MVTITTLKQTSDSILAKLIEKTTYLQIGADAITQGIVGENDTEVFNVTSSFVRIYVQQKETQEFDTGARTRRKGTLMVLCGIAGIELSETSFLCQELAERVEAILHGCGSIYRSSEPIFTVKNTEGISIFAVPFWFLYNSSAGDPNE